MMLEIIRELTATEEPDEVISVQVKCLAKRGTKSTEGITWGNNRDQRIQRIGTIKTGHWAKQHTQNKTPSKKKTKRKRERERDKSRGTPQNTC